MLATIKKLCRKIVLLIGLKNLFSKGFIWLQKTLAILNKIMDNL